MRNASNMNYDSWHTRVDLFSIDTNLDGFMLGRPETRRITICIYGTEKKHDVRFPTFRTVQWSGNQSNTPRAVRHPGAPFTNKD